MSMVIADNYYGPLTRISSAGAGPDSKALENKLNEVDKHFRRSIIREQPNPIDSLYEVYKEYSQQNWDGYGALPISKAAFFEAIKIINLLPPFIPTPEIEPELTGGIAFEWHKGEDHMFVISVRGNSTVMFAGIFGEEKIHGVIPLEEFLPLDIVQSIQRLL